jgi:aminoglycoside phosphotransferase (APT) family kinase protein
VTVIADESVLRPKIEALLRERSGRPVEVGEIRRFPVGFSWLTFSVPVIGLDPERPGDTTTLILRLGPDYGLFAPYSAGPQVLSMRTLERSAVPVPRALWSSDDPSILGAPFLFCSKVDGDAVVPWVSKHAPALDDARRKRLGEQFIDILAALHAFDWRGSPMAELDDGVTPTNAALRVVEFWEAQIARWAMRPYPLAEWGIRWLKANAPLAPRVSIVHGDYRTGNFLERGGTITAMLDWELAHLGDPYEDIGWMTLPMYMGGTPYFCRLVEPEWFYRRYAERSGTSVDMRSVHYYQVFNLLKLAATHMGAARRFEEGPLNDLRMPAMGSQIATCLRQMDKAIARGTV